MLQYLAIPGAVAALLGIGAILFKGFKASVRAIIAIDTLIKSIEANTAAHTKIAKTVERFRKTTQKEIAGVKGQIKEIDSRLDNHDAILSPPKARKAG